MYSQKYGWVERPQVFCAGLTLSIFLTGTALAAVHSLSVIMPRPCMRSSTMLRRTWARSGLWIGSVLLGCCTRPASSADWATVSLAAVVLK